MKIYRYPLRALTGDYLRALAGLGLGLGVVATNPSSPALLAIFGGLGAVFALFAARTLQRHLTKVAVTETEICDRGFGTRVMAWAELGQMKLRFYGTKRQQAASGGFMQLTFKGAGRAFTFESSLEGFDYLTWRAAKAARDNGVSLDPSSAGNLLAMGLDADGEKPAPEP